MVIKAVFEVIRERFSYVIEDLKHFFLFNGEVQVVRYDARIYHSGPSEEQHRFVQVDEGYTHERIASYWQTARHYLHREYFEKPRDEGREHPTRLWYPWRVVSQGSADFLKVREGRACFPESAEPESTSPQGAPSFLPESRRRPEGRLHI